MNDQDGRDLSTALAIIHNSDKQRSVDAAAWLAEPDEPADPIIDDLFEAGENVAVVGSAKAGKSFIAMQLAVCIAAGIPFLGRPTHPRRVLAVNLEISARQYKKRLRRMVESFNIPQTYLADWLFIENLKNEDVSWSSVKADALTREAQVLLIDPFYQIFRGEEINELDIQAAIDEMKDIQKSGLTLIMVYHAPKGFNGDRNLRDMISGSSRLARYPESILGILSHAEGEDYRVFDSVLRNYPPQGEETLRLDGGAFVPDETVAPVVESAASRKRKQESTASVSTKASTVADMAQKLRDAIMRLVEDRGESLQTRDQIAAALMQLGYAKNRTEQSISVLRDDGRLVAVQESTIIKGKVTPIPRRMGGRTFITTPELADDYRAKIR